MARRPLAVLALCVACSANETRPFVDLSQLDREFVVLGSLIDDDHIDGSLVVAPEELTRDGGELSVSSAHRLIGVAFDREELIARSPRLDLTALHRLALRRAPAASASCAEGVLDPQLHHAQIQWPERTLAFEWRLDEERLEMQELGSGWATRVGPVVPIDADRCLAHPELRAHPFATPEPILTERSVVNGEVLDIGGRNLNDFVRLDEERVLVVYPRYVVIAERGRGYVDEPGRNLGADPDWKLRAVAVSSPEPATDTRRLVLVSLDGSADISTTRSRIAEASMTGYQITAGRVLLETSSIVDAAYVFPDTGRTLVYERPAQIYADAEPGGELTLVAQLPNTQPQTDKRGRLVATGLSDYPVALVGSRSNTVYFGSADGRSWINAEQGLSLGLNVRGFASLIRPGRDPVLYAGNTAGHAFTRALADEAWRRLDLRLDPALIELECARASDGPTCGFAEPRLSWQHFTVFDDGAGRPALLAFSDLCSLTFVIGADGCVSHFQIEDFGQIARNADDEILLARSEGGAITLATERGRLFELPWAALGIGP